MKTVEEVIEDIQEAQIAAGGRFLRQKQIKELSVKDLLELLLPNNVVFYVHYQLPKQDK
jgi:hypothetical protein